MQKSFDKLIAGYRRFRKRYAHGDGSIMQQLAQHGQRPEVMVIACCDSRVDPALILQCSPGDLFVVRNVANIVPPYEADNRSHGTSAALEFGICHLGIKHLIIWGHSHCGGIDALEHGISNKRNDFITNWVSLIPKENCDGSTCLSQAALLVSYQNCLTFPWIRERIDEGTLTVHLWYLDIKEGLVWNYSFSRQVFQLLEESK